MKLDKSRHSSTIAFLDFVFNLVLAFVMLVILLLFVVKAENAKPAPENKNEFIITVHWDDGTDDDVDTWVKDPTGKVISFQNKEVPGMHLQRDDIGRANKRVASADGIVVEEPKNMEVVNITSWIPGTYIVNLHLYRANRVNLAEVLQGTAVGEGEVTVEVKLMKVNPYGEAAKVQVKLDRAIFSQEKTAFSFTVNEKGEVTDVNSLPVSFVRLGAGSVSYPTEPVEPVPSMPAPR